MVSVSFFGFPLNQGEKGTLFVNMGPNGVLLGGSCAGGRCEPQPVGQHRATLPDGLGHSARMPGPRHPEKSSSELGSFS